LVLRRNSWFTWLFQPEIQLPVLAVLLLLCYAFARHLTSPVRELQRAVDCFGRGELVARVNSKRKDELGQLARTFDNMADRIQSLLDAQRQLLLDISH
jgi:two-component system sensor histidine kinase CpxA